MKTRTGLDSFAKEFEETEAGKSKLLELKRQLRSKKNPENKIEVKTDQDFCKFALIGDTHIGSKYFQPAKLKSFFEYAEKLGYRTVLHAGDVVDGWKIYKGQEFEQNGRGWSEQRDMFEEFYPKIDGMKTYFITGNHDDSFEKLAGAIIGEELQNCRDDCEFIGQNLASVEFETKTGKVICSLMHPGGGSAYSLSYRPQKIIEQWEGGKKPHLLGIGHFHKAEIMPQYRNIVSIQTGTFQGQTPFMQGKGISAHVGGWLVDVCHDDDQLDVVAHWKSFF